MRIVLFLAVFGHWTVSSAGEQEQSCQFGEGVTEATITHEGRERQYVLYRPENLPLDIPIVFMLHGFGSSAKVVMNGTGLNEIADSNHFTVVYPQGLKVKDVTSNVADYGDSAFWNSSPGYGLQLDDVGFLSELASHLQSECDFGAHRRFIVGHSNGGAMSYTMACLGPEVFNAIASIAGPEEYVCESPRAVPVLHIHGVQDDVVPIEGSASEESDKQIRSIRQTVDFWAAANNYESLSEEFIPPATTTFRYYNDIDDNEVWYYRIENWGHGWPRAADNTGTDAGEVIWRFFSRY